MSSRKKYAAYNCSMIEFPIVILLLSLVIVVLLPVVRELRDGVRNGYNAQELLGTVVNGIGEGLFGAVVFVCGMVVLFFGFAGFILAAEYIHRRWNRTTDDSTMQSAESEASEPETSDTRTE